MFSRLYIVGFLCMLFTFHFIDTDAQKANSNASAEKMKIGAPHELLFDNDEILNFKLTGKLNNLFTDRKDNMSSHPMLLEYRAGDSSVSSMQLTVKTRGNFRRDAKNCKMPPLMLSFSGKDIIGTIFENQKKLKLVVPCKGDEYVVREWLVYKLYNLLTEKSFKAKLVKVEFEDSLKKRSTEEHYCILLEDEKKLATRNETFVWNKKMLPMNIVDRKDFTKMAVFQYMIGNTDWSVPYLQNIKIITKDSTKTPFAVPYDFDHAGIVDAPYAAPAEELELTSVRQRIYRGYCEKDKKIFAQTFELFNKYKDDFYKIYTSCSIVSSKYIKSTIKFLDDFYRVINNDKTSDIEFENPCHTDVRVEIKGLKK